jgi:hypothetical protein
MVGTDLAGQGQQSRERYVFNGYFHC